MKVFLSHIHEEASLANIFKEWIESTFPDKIQVFVSSDIKDIPAGSKWLAEIDSALISSCLFLMLCSPRSLPRPWINFEAGCAWIKKVPLIPLCHSGVKKSDLPSPISVFEALDLTSDKFVDDFFESIRLHFEISKLPRIDKNAFLNELNQAIKKLKLDAPPKQTTITKVPHVISDADALNIIESWMGNRPASSSLFFRYADVDSELNLPEGTAKKFIEEAARSLNYITRRKAEDTILFSEQAYL